MAVATAAAAWAAWITNPKQLQRRSRNGAPFFRMFLFKYCRPDRGTQIIEKLKIRFSPPSVFNDPFDGLSDTALLVNPKWIEKIKANVAAEFKWMGNEEIHAMVEQTYRENLEEGESLKKQFINIQRADLDRYFRILSLSQVPPNDPKSLLLWGHYATGQYGHDGMAIEFDESHPWVRLHNPERGKRYEAGAMIYDKKRATYHELNPNRVILFTKSEHWNYEAEYRLIRFIGDPDFETDEVDALVKFNADLLKSVTLGVGATKETEDKLKEIVRNNPALSKLKLRRAEIHNDEYRLQFIDI